jgi:hypothetical protein
MLGTSTLYILFGILRPGNEKMFLTVFVWQIPESVGRALSLAAHKRRYYCGQKREH